MSADAGGGVKVPIVSRGAMPIVLGYSSVKDSVKNLLHTMTRQVVGKGEGKTMWLTAARILLGERLDRMKKEYARDVTYNDSLIRSIMDAPMALYLMHFQKEQEQLAAIFRCSMEEV